MAVTAKVPKTSFCLISYGVLPTESAVSTHHGDIMTFKSHHRQYDLVVFGATGENGSSLVVCLEPDSWWRLGYTGLYTAEHIATHLPTDLKWAIAGRSRDKLEKTAADIAQLNRDRRPACQSRPIPFPPQDSDVLTQASHRGMRSQCQ